MPKFPQDLKNQANFLIWKVNCVARFNYTGIIEQTAFTCSLLAPLILLPSLLPFQRPSKKPCCKLKQSSSTPVFVWLVFNLGKSLDCLKPFFFPNNSMVLSSRFYRFHRDHLAVCASTFTKHLKNSKIHMQCVHMYRIGFLFRN